jgi:hypothetical protein
VTIHAGIRPARARVEGLPGSVIGVSQLHFALRERSNPAFHEAKQLIRAIGVVDRPGSSEVA